MRREKWSTYLDVLQGHPTVCQSSHTLEGMKAITEFIPPDKFPRMLNIGAGEGLETYLLSQLGYNVIGVINGKTNLDYAYEHFPEIVFVESDMHDLPFPSESFHAVYTNHTFEHTFAPFILLLELYCILKVGGRIWIAMPDFREPEDGGGLSHHHPNIMCYNIFKPMFEATGFKIIHSRKTEKYPYFDNPYLLEKQPISSLHSDVQTVIRKRKKLFG